MSDAQSVTRDQESNITLVAVTAHPRKTPWWARRAGLNFTHMAVAVSGETWEQPINGRGHAMPSVEWWHTKQCDERTVLAVLLSVRPDQRRAVLDALDSLNGKKGQRVRTVLRHLRLWPSVPWNCLGPPRVVVQALGFSGRGETPDDFLELLVEEGTDETMSLYLSTAS